jgi:hypothetical protein
VGKGDTNHGRLNDDLGLADEPVTVEFLRFLDDCAGATPR